MRFTKNKSSIFILLIIFTLLVLSQVNFAMGINSNQLSDRLYINKMGLSIKAQKDYIEKDYAGNIYPKNSSQIELNNGQIMNIIFVDASDLKDAKLLLERFLLTFHGVAERYAQKQTSVKNQDSFQAIYNIHNHDDEEYFDIFTAIKKGDSGWVFVSSLSIKKDSLKKVDVLSTLEFKNYEKLLNSIEFVDDQKINEKKVKLKDFKEIKSEFLELNQRINRKFDIKY